MPALENSASAPQIHDERVGDVRRCLPGNLHGQPRGLHDNAGGVLRLQWHRRPSTRPAHVPQAHDQVRHRALDPHRQHLRQVLQGDVRLHEELQQKQRRRGYRVCHQWVSQPIQYPPPPPAPLLFPFFRFSIRGLPTIFPRRDVHNY
jgi:hypothetical protein